MSDTEIAQLNERVARVLDYDAHQPPDFYHDIRLCGEMMEWLRTKNIRYIEPFGQGWDVRLKDSLTLHGSLSACLCRAIDAVAKGRET